MAARFLVALGFSVAFSLIGLAQEPVVPAVASVQSALRLLGYRVEQTGTVDVPTQLALKVAQQGCGVAPSGRIDSATASCLTRMLQKRVDAARVTLSDAEAALASFAAGQPIPARLLPPPLPIHVSPPSVEPTESAPSTTNQIRAFCSQQWATDFRMRAYCEEQQQKAAAALAARSMMAGDRLTIRTKCERDWPSDYRMRNYCEEKQLEALARLQR